MKSKTVRGRNDAVIGLGGEISHGINFPQQISGDLKNVQFFFPLPFSEVLLL